MRRILSVGLLLCLTIGVRADGPADNLPDKVRRIPPLPKDPVTVDVKNELKTVAEAKAELEKI